MKIIDYRTDPTDAIPRAGEAFERLVDQLNQALASGQADHVMLWSLKDYSMEDLIRLQEALGPAYDEVTILSGVEELYTWLITYGQTTTVPPTP